MSNRVFIGGLPDNTREKDVEDFLSDFGKVRDVVMKQRFAFVEFEDKRDADDAIHELNGRRFLGDSRVSLEWAKSTPRRDGGYRRSPPPRRQFWSPPRNRSLRYDRPYRTDFRIHIKNLSSRVSWQDLKDMMREIGHVTYTDAHRMRPNEAFVDFASSRDVRVAIDKFDGKEINGRRLRVVDDSRDQKSVSRSRSRSRSDSYASGRSKSGERRHNSRRSTSWNKERRSRSGSADSRSYRNHSNRGENGRRGSSERRRRSYDD